MQTQVKGKIKLIKNIEIIQEIILIRELIIATDEQFPQFLKIDFFKNNYKLLDDFKEGEKVIVSIDLRGKEWISPTDKNVVKYFNQLRGIKIERITEKETETKHFEDLKKD